MRPPPGGSAERDDAVGTFAPGRASVGWSDMVVRTSALASTLLLTLAFAVGARAQEAPSPAPSSEESASEAPVPPPPTSDEAALPPEAPSVASPGDPPQAAPAAADGGSAKDSAPSPSLSTEQTAGAAPAPPPAPIDAAPGVELDGWRLINVQEDKRPLAGATSDTCGFERNVVVERLGDAITVRRAVFSVPCVAGASGPLEPGAPSLRLIEEEQKKGTPPTPAAIHAAIVPYTGQIAECQRRDPTARGLIHVKWHILPSGRASDIQVRGTLRSPGIERCVVAEIWTWQLPTHDVEEGVPYEQAFGFDGPASDVLRRPGSPLCRAGELPRAPADLAPNEVACVIPEARPCAEGETPLAPHEVPVGTVPCKPPGGDPSTPFLKGELTHYGDIQLVNVRSSFGVGLGLTVLGDALYAQVRPDINMHFGKFHLGLGAPLRFELLDWSDLTISPDILDKALGDFGQFRGEDWDQVEDFFRPLRYLTWGRKEDNLYIDINRVHSVTLGHGQLIRRYAPNVDIDEDNLVAAVDGYNDFGGFELLAGPLPVPRVAGALVFIKPMSFFTEDKMLRTWSVGLSVASDLNAPTVLAGNVSAGRQQLAVDRANQFTWQGKNNLVGATVQGIGIDSEIKLLKTEHVDIKTYADYSRLLFPADTSDAQAFDAFSAGGGAVGGLLRVSLGKTPVRSIEQESEEVRTGRAPREMKAAHAFRVRLEGRLFESQFLPSYFNTLYEVDRLQFGLARTDGRGALPTKVGFLAQNAGEPMRAGVYLEASYAWVDALGLTFMYEDAQALGEASRPLQARNFAVHAETAGGGFLQLFATYHYRNFENLDALFSFTTDNEVLYAGGRVVLLPFLFLNVAAQRAFRVGFGPDDSSRQTDAGGFRYTSVGLANAWAYGADLELGWQF